MKFSEGNRGNRERLQVRSKGGSTEEGRDEEEKLLGKNWSMPEMGPPPTSVTPASEWESLERKGLQSSASQKPRAARRIVINTNQIVQRPELKNRKLKIKRKPVPVSPLGEIASSRDPESHDRAELEAGTLHSQSKERGDRRELFRLSHALAEERESIRTKPESQEAGSQNRDEAVE